MVIIDKRRINTDVFIVGGGPAGLAAGIAAARKGFRVVIADRVRPPIDKACGEGLMPDGLAALKRLGVVLPEESGHPFRGIRFIGRRRELAGSFPNGCGVGIRRTKLHDLLAQSASSAGLSLFWGSHVKSSPDGSLLLDGSPVSSRWVIGADGLNSRVREWAGIRFAGRSQIRYGWRSHFQIKPWSEYVEVNWGPECQMIVTPVSAMEICAALMAKDSTKRFDPALRLFPELKLRLRDAPQTSPVTGALSIQRRLRAVSNGRFALVGDASGSVDAITGEGLCLAFQQAECLADALESNDLRYYEQQYRSIRRRPSLMACLMLQMDRRPVLCDAALRVLDGCPATFSALLALHVGGVRRGNSRQSGRGVTLPPLERQEDLSLL